MSENPQIIIEYGNPEPHYIEYEGEASPTVIEQEPEPEAFIIQLPGEPGPRGPAGGEVHEFQQTEPAEVWTVNHNLGRHPSGIQVRDSTGRVVGTEIHHLSPNTFTSTSDDAFSGRISYSG